MKAKILLLCALCALLVSPAWAVVGTPVGGGGAGGAPTDAPYILSTPDGDLSNGVALSALATGMLKSTTTTGALSIAVPNTDYYAPDGVFVANTTTDPSFTFTGDTNTGMYWRLADHISFVGGGVPLAEIIHSGGTISAIRIGADDSFAWSSDANPTVATHDTMLRRGATGGIIEQRNLTNAQSYHLYETYAGVSDYERLALVAGSDSFGLVAQTAGTGTDDLPLYLQAAGLSSVEIRSPLKLEEAPVTIATGAFTATRSYHKLSAEGGVADTLDTINGGEEGDILVIQNASDSVDITFSSAGNIILDGGPLMLDHLHDTIMLINNGTTWLEIGRSTEQRVRSLELIPFGYTADWTTGDGKAYIQIPADLDGYYVSNARVDVLTAGTTNSSTLQLVRIRAGTPVDILTDVLEVETGETSSTTALPATSVNASNRLLQTADLIRIDCDTVSSTPPKGAFVIIELTKGPP